MKTPSLGSTEPPAAGRDPGEASGAPRIRILDEPTASRIAAGEVVERPASAVKELVENSLDAGATSIDVEIEAGGKRRIRIADNGRGIPADQVADAFARYATSKIRDVSDLESVTTMGFRGEALAAIASVSRVSMVTRAAGGSAGTRLEVVGGRVGSVVPMGAAPGTVVSVEDLFFAVPARLKFLSSDTAEGARVAEVMGRLVMANPAVRFTLARDGKRVLASPGSGRRQDAIAAVLGRTVAADLIPAGEVAPAGAGWPNAGAPETDLAAVGGQTGSRVGKISVSGLVSPPHLHKASRRDIVLFVNGRWIQDKALAFAVAGAYATLLPKSRFPVAVLWLQIDSRDVDVNVHPAKTEVRFRSPDAVFSAVRRAVADALGVAPVAPARSSYLGSRGDPPSGGHGWATTAGGSWGAAPADLPGLAVGPAGVRERRTWDEFRTIDDSITFSEPAEASISVDPTNPAVSAERSAGGALPALRPLGQIGLTYLVAEGPDGLVLIDQHAAHERVLYEELMGRRGPVLSQRLLAPDVAELTPAEMDAFEAHGAALTGAGFDVEPFGPAAVAVRAVPHVAASVDPGGLLRAVLDGLDAGTNPLEAAVHERIASIVCKRASVKAGQPLGLIEARALIEALEATAAPLTCPHGRPTTITFSRQRLEREFGRT